MRIYQSVSLVENVNFQMKFVCLRFRVKLLWKTILQSMCEQPIRTKGTNNKIAISKTCLLNLEISIRYTSVWVRPIKNAYLRMSKANGVVCYDLCIFDEHFYFPNFRKSIIRFFCFCPTKTPCTVLLSFRNMKFQVKSRR